MNFCHGDVETLCDVKQRRRERRLRGKFFVKLASATVEKKFNIFLDSAPENITHVE